MAWVQGVAASPLARGRKRSLAYAGASNHGRHETKPGNTGAQNLEDMRLGTARGGPSSTPRGADTRTTWRR